MNVSRDGMLSSLGEFAPQQEYYAVLHRHAKRMEAGHSQAGSAATSPKSSRGVSDVSMASHAQSIHSLMDKLADTKESVRESLRRNCICADDLVPANWAIRESLLHVVLLLVYLLVPDEVRCAQVQC
jgi:hypothetical protein